MHQLKAVLFDLDGVLLDSEGAYTDFWTEIDNIYHTGIDNFAHFIKGSTLETILEKYFPEKSIQSAICAQLSHMEANMPLRLFDGADNLIQDLSRRGISMAIVTSSGHKKMMNVFDAIPVFKEKIDVLITDEDVTASKPDPEGYLLAAHRLNAEEGEFVVVEDSLAGLTAGRRAGAIVVGIATTNPREKVAPLADMVVDSIEELSADILLDFCKNK